LLALLAVSALVASGVATESLAARKHNATEVKTATPIKHLVIAANTEVPLFYAKDDTPSVNGLTGNLLTNNPNLFNPVRLGREGAYTCSLNHDYTSEQKAVDGGLMDKFVQATSRTGTGCATDGSTVMGYFDGNTVTALGTTPSTTR
jgi:phospholipase C